MTHDFLTDLEAEICRAVAPLAASARRKQFIREELLGHL
jgi:hypothetical protein